MPARAKLGPNQARLKNTTHKSNTSRSPARTALSFRHLQEFDQTLIAPRITSTLVTHDQRHRNSYATLDNRPKGQHAPCNCRDSRHRVAVDHAPSGFAMAPAAGPKRPAWSSQADLEPRAMRPRAESPAQGGRIWQPRYSAHRPLEKFDRHGATRDTDQWRLDGANQLRKAA